MDHMMPEMDGVETMKNIRQRGGKNGELPIVLLTANAVSGVREQMLEQGFDDFLSKPIDVDELKRVLARFLGVKFET
jgi:CheY-like chemotaxis protein